MTTKTRVIDGYAAKLTQVQVDDERVALWQVDDLERHVDRDALLGGGNPPEPPYWAQLWSGALVLARAVPLRPPPTLELGAGLGLPGLLAGCRGAPVVFVDRELTPLRFIRASAVANGVANAATVAADFTQLAARRQFPLILAAEILYDRSLFAHLAQSLRRLLAPGGLALLTDGGRIDTRDFYTALAGAGLSYVTTEERVREEGVVVTIRRVEIRPGY